MSKHTAGPWKLELVEKYPFGFLVTAANGDEILREEAVCRSSDQKTRQDNELGVGFPFRSARFTRDDASRLVSRQDANARLISAAPDLLEALQVLLEHIEIGRLSNEIGPANVEFAREAIANATGES